jgi:two-component system cell cycle response regulator
METDSLLPENPDCQKRRLLPVLPLGFEAADVERLKNIFKLALQENQYVVISRESRETIGILLVNYDNPSALIEKDAILKHDRDIPVVAVSRGPLSEPVGYHIRGMLMAARVLGVLDKVPIRGPGSASRHSAVESGVERGLAPSSGSEAALSPAAEHRTLADRDHREGGRLHQESPNPHANRAETPTGTGGYRALVVDDSTAIQKSLELNLTTLEQIAAVDFADSGEVALEKCESTRYDLIFLDVMMPGIDGYETCSRLRKRPEYKKTPIIMVSGKTSPLDEVKGVMAGCTTYVTKPIQKEEFQKLSSRVLAWLANYKTCADSSC